MIIFVIVRVYHKCLSVPEKIFPSPSWPSTFLDFVAFFNLLSFGGCIVQYLKCVHPSGFGGLEVACWPFVQRPGSNPAEAVGFLRVNNNPQHVGGHGCLSVVIVVCCQVEVSATN